MTKHTSRLATAIAMGLPLLAQAQANPADTASAAPPLRYQSAFSDYKPWRDIEPGDWRVLNDALRETGGHAGHGSTSPAAPRQATPASSTAVPAQPAPSAGHGGHHMHGDGK